MTVYSVILAALAAAVLIVTVKQYKPELALPLGIAAGAVVLTAVVSFAMPLVSQLKSIAENSGIKNEYFILMLKSLGICYITQFAADICTDFGQSSLASKIELFGKVALAAVNLPLIISLINTVSNLVG